MRAVTEHLGRRVYLGGWSSLENEENISLIDSTVLLWLGESGLPGRNERQLVGALLARSPLAVLVGGGGAERVFDCALTMLDENTSFRVPMTGFSEESIANCVEEFLHATWPFEGYFEDWRRYLILALADPREVEEAVLKLY
jgi:hypothetical protein